MSSKWSTSLRVNHLISIAVVSSNTYIAANLTDSLNKTANAGINSLNSLDSCRNNTGMTNHITICIVQDDKVILAGLDSFNNLVSNLNSTHLRLKIIGSNLWRRYQDTILTLIWLLYTAIEEESYMSILLSLCDTQLSHAILGNNLTKGILNGFRRICHLNIQAFLILSHSCKGQLCFLAGKTAELFISKGVSQLTSSIRTEVEEDYSITIVYTLIVTYNNRNNKFVSYIISVGCIDSFHSVRSLDTFTTSNSIISFLNTLPAIVTIHCIVTTRQSGNCTAADFVNLRLQLSYILSCRGRIYITTIQESMHVYLLDTLLFGQLQQSIQMLAMAVNTAWRNQTHEMQSAAVCLYSIGYAEQSLVLKEISVLDCLGNTGKSLINNSACTNIGMSNLGVTHLSIRQTNIFARGKNMSSREFLL